MPAQLTSRSRRGVGDYSSAGEQKLFSRDGTRAPASARNCASGVAQTNEEIRGLSRSRRPRGELQLIAKELAGVESCRNLVSISRFTQLQRDQTRIQGERSQLIADIARARARSVKPNYRSSRSTGFPHRVLKTCGSRGKIAELRERSRNKDQLSAWTCARRRPASSTSSRYIPSAA